MHDVTMANYYALFTILCSQICINELDMRMLVIANKH